MMLKNLWLLDEYIRNQKDAINSKFEEDNNSD